MYTLVPFHGNRRMISNVDHDLFDDRFFRSFFNMNDMMGSQGFRVDVKNKDDHYEIQAELPGVKEDQIDLSVEDDVLTISCDMNSEKKEEKDSYLYSERRFGHMERRFNLEGINQEGIAASFDNGLLTVNLPKVAQQEAPKARKIAIGGGKVE